VITVPDSGGRRIADRSAREQVRLVTFFVWLVSAPFLFLVVPGFGLVLKYPPALAIVVYLLVVAAALVWTSYRAWCFGVRFDDDGVTVWNYFRTVRASWHEVACFADGTTNGRNWALKVLLRDGRVLTATSTRARVGSPYILAAAQEAAARHGVPAQLTGTGAKPPRPRHDAEPAGSRPAPDRLSAWRAARLMLGPVICGIVAIGLAITEMASYRILPGYLLAVGILASFAAPIVNGVTDAFAKLEKQYKVLSRIVAVAVVGGILSLFVLAIFSGHGAAVNDST
jgi:hypothetical protein